MKEYSNRLNFHPMVLYKPDIYELIEVINESFSEPPIHTNDLVIEVKFGSTELHENKLDKIFAINPLPDYFDSLDIRRYDYNSNGDIDKSISLTFYGHSGGYCYVSGFDNTWVVGKTSRIKSVLEKHRTILSKLIRNYYLISAFLGALFVLGIAALSYSLSIRNIFGSILSCILIALSMWLFYAGMTGSVLPFIRIYAHEKQRRRLSGDFWLLIFTIATFLLLVADFVMKLVIK